MHAVDQARLLAAKAFLLVRQAPPAARAALEANAEKAARQLEAASSVETLRRAVFYRLMLAELAREADPVPARVRAMDLGDRLQACGQVNPVPLYMKIVEATTEPTTTAAFGDFKSAPMWSHHRSSQSPLVKSQQIRSDSGHVFRALGLSEALVTKYDRFLWLTELSELFQHHGLTSDVGT